jgi:hypothetical protein
MLVENATSPWGQFWERVFQDCSHGEIRHFGTEVRNEDQGPDQITVDSIKYPIVTQLCLLTSGN